MVDQAEIGTNHSYLIDSIKIQANSKTIDAIEVRRLYIENQLSAAQIARQYGVVKSVVLGILHRSGVRLVTGSGRLTNPENYRNHCPPYGYAVKAGKLMPSKTELKICRAIVELRGRRGLSTAAVALELERHGFKNRNGRAVWNPNTILKIFKRWDGKL